MNLLAIEPQMNKSLYVFLLLFVFKAASAQILTPVKWTFSVEVINNAQAKLILKAKIDKGWHIYSQFTPEGGPIPTSFQFKPSKDYELVNKTTETPKAISTFDKTFNMLVLFHENEVSFIQLLKAKSSKFKVKGTLEYMACTNAQCLPPEDVPFDIAIELPEAPTTNVSSTISSSISTISSSSNTSSTGKQPTVLSVAKTTHTQATHTATATIKNHYSGSLWAIFLAGFLGGLAAFFMPCIYPMVPLTISFFTKKSHGSQAKGIERAIIYGLSIILIYVALGLFITLSFGASALNEAASSATFNLLFFLILVVFAISFLGAFEITLPSALVNKMNEKSDSQGLLGVFFMAFTLALVSFSCTGPIIGTLLVDAVSKGSYLGPTIGMLGFSSALAIPFTLFAIFPAWLKEMPKSGSWLNMVKVSLGFLELALAFKFLSNVDLAYHWHILNRDIFLVIWISIFAVFALYLLGKIRFEHDSETSFLSLPRLFFATLVLGFTIYMIPGLWGAPLNAINGWLPPQGKQNFGVHENCYSSIAQQQTSQKKYTNLFHSPNGLDAYYDYEEGLAYAKQVNKPVFLDFTGWSCTNCRKMESSVWSDPEVLRRLKEDYVLVSLYVDDKTPLPENQKYISKFSGKHIERLGQKWSDLQASQFGTNSQPYYAIIDHQEKMLVPGEGFNLDINHYIQFLAQGKRVFNTK